MSPPKEPSRRRSDTSCPQPRAWHGGEPPARGMRPAPSFVFPGDTKSPKPGQIQVLRARHRAPDFVHGVAKSLTPLPGGLPSRNAGAERGCPCLAGGCVPNPCLNGGTCTEDGAHLACLCLPGYGGSSCERRESHGASTVPTLHGGPGGVNVGIWGIFWGCSRAGLRGADPVLSPRLPPAVVQR